MTRALFFLLVSFAAVPALAQPININFGVLGDGPSSDYAAAGMAGTWNTLESMPAVVRFPLVGLDGAPLAADIRQIGGDFILAADDPATSGDDERLLDTMYWTFQNPPDACFWIDNLENGEYQVLLYAMTPGDPSIISEVRVDNPPDASAVGGAWPGQHTAGITFHAFTQTVTNGEIGLHAGLPGDGVRSGLNGIQLIPATAGIGLAEPVAPSHTTLLRAFPNPARFSQTIELNVAERDAGHVDIVDVAGRLVWRHALNGAPGVRLIEWDGRDLLGQEVGAAVYFVRLPGFAAEERAGGRQIKLIRID